MNKQTVLKILVLVILCMPLIFPKIVQAFRFVSWADTKSGTSTLKSLSIQLNNLSPAPVFTIFPGDVCSSGPDSTCFPNWKNAINGGSSPGNGLFNKTFAARGNHDDSSSYWITVFNIQSTAQAVGATNLSQLSANLTYSFDYENSHFVGLDNSGGDSSSLSSAIITWLDNDLATAQARTSITHIFIFFSWTDLLC